MDVVYNHSFHSSGRPSTSWCLAATIATTAMAASNGSCCGNELADERSMVRKFIVDSVTYWAQEYKFVVSALT